MHHACMPLELCTRYTAILMLMTLLIQNRMRLLSMQGDTDTCLQLNEDAGFAELVGNHVIPEEAGTGKKEDAGDGVVALAAEADVKDEKKPTRAVVDKNLTGNEDRAKGAVGTAVIARYVLAAGGTIWAAAVLTMYIFEQGTKIFTDTWLSFWVGDRFDKSLTFYLLIYASLGFAFALVTYMRAITFVYGTVRSLSMVSLVV